MPKIGGGSMREIDKSLLASWDIEGFTEEEIERKNALRKVDNAIFRLIDGQPGRNSIHRAMRSVEMYMYYKIDRMSREQGENFQSHFYKDEYDKLVDETINEYYELFLQKVEKRIKDDGIDIDVFKREYIDNHIKEYGMNLIKKKMTECFEKQNRICIIPDDKPKPLTRAEAYEAEIEWRKRNAGNIPTFWDGFIVLLFFMAITIILNERVGLWILEVIIFLRWRSKEIKKYYNPNYDPRKDPYFRPHVSSREEYEKMKKNSMK